MPEYIKKYWDIPDDQPVGRELPTGFLSPSLDVINTFNLTVTSEEYLKVMSAINVGAKIAYPEEWGALVDIWLHMALQQQDYITDGTYYRMDAPFIKWYPDTPFKKDSDLLPQGQLFPAWFVYSLEYPEFVTDFLSWFGIEWDTFLGYRVGDAISTIFNMRVGNLSGIITDWLFGNQSSSFAKVGFEIHVKGSGTLGLEVLNVPLGGRVLWQIDDPIDLALTAPLQAIFDKDDDLLETDLDIVSIPPEQDVEDVEEITIEGDGNHIIYVQLLPVINDQLFPIAFGAGFRSIRLGEGLTPINPETGEEFEGLLKSTSDLGLITVTTQDVREGVRLGLMDYHSQALSGQAGNTVGGVTVNPDGTITVSEGGSGGVSGTTEQQLSGAVREVRIGLDQFLSDFESYYQTYGTALITPTTFLKSKYLTDEALLDQAYADYVTYREGAGAVLSPFGVNLDQYLFCDGVTKQVVNTYIIDELATDDLLQIQIVDSLLTDQFGVWYDDGILKPQDEYLPFPCVRREEWTVEYTAAQFIADTPVYLDAPTGFAHYPTDRRVRITLSGKFEDSTDAENTSDPFYRTANGVAGATPQVYDRFRLDNGSGSTTFIVYPDTIPAYNPDGNYSWIVIVNQANYNDFYINENIAANDTWRANATGSIMITITDLGEA